MLESPVLIKYKTDKKYHQKWGGAISGAGVALGIAGGILYYLAGSSQDKADDSYASYQRAATAEKASSYRSETEDYNNSAGTYKSMAYVGIGLAACAFVTGIYYFATTPDHPFKSSQRNEDQRITNDKGTLIKVKPGLLSLRVEF